MNELLGWYGYDNEERMEITSKINNINCKNSKKIASISQKLLETKQNIITNNNNNSNCSSNNSSIGNQKANNSNNIQPPQKIPRQINNDCSSVSSDKDSSREDSKSPTVLKINDKKG
jgi:hypothetical protein